MIGDNAKGVLCGIVSRIEKLEDEKATISQDIKEVYAEAKSTGLDPKIIRALIKERKRDKAEIEEEEALKETYRVALGMLADLPLGKAALGEPE